MNRPLIVLLAAGLLTGCISKLSAPSATHRGPSAHRYGAVDHAEIRLPRLDVAESAGRSMPAKRLRALRGRPVLASVSKAPASPPSSPASPRRTAYKSTIRPTSAGAHGSGGSGGARAARTMTPCS